MSFPLQPPSNPAIAQAVSDSISEFKRTGLSRAKEMAGNPEALVQYERYTADADPRVRREVAYAAAYAHSDHAVEVLTKLIGDREEGVGGDATRLLYKNWDGPTLARVGGQALEKALMDRLGHNDADSRATLILAYFPSNRGGISFLNGLRQQQAMRGVKAQFEQTPPIGDAVVITDLALAVLNAPGAAGKVAAMVANGTVAQKILLADAIPYVKAPELLATLADMLRDDRKTEVMFNPEEPTPYPVGDLALRRFRDAGLLPMTDYYTPTTAAQRESLLAQLHSTGFKR